MNVHQLKQILKDLPDDLPVTVKDFTFDFCADIMDAEVKEAPCVQLSTKTAPDEKPRTVLILIPE